ncbi:MAG: hypothetical protein HC929_23410 [Leptolyngbyaceae cyanobacterium SM2_5_2]|nr:hypothetical protein [Leptolyngbyaceae cyanobacterium SM2_5_2]
MTSSAQPSENFEQRALAQLERLTQAVEQFSEEVGQLSEDVEQLSEDVETGNARFEKWDGRLWGLTLGLISTAWTAIFAAAAVVITRTLSGQ